LLDEEERDLVIQQYFELILVQFLKEIHQFMI